MLVMLPMMCIDMQMYSLPSEIASLHHVTVQTFYCSDSKETLSVIISSLLVYGDCQNVKGLKRRKRSGGLIHNETAKGQKCKIVAFRLSIIPQ